jgi:hypothetical protein
MLLEDDDDVVCHYVTHILVILCCPFSTSHVLGVSILLTNLKGPSKGGWPATASAKTPLMEQDRTIASCLKQHLRCKKAAQKALSKQTILPTPMIWRVASGCQNFLGFDPKRTTPIQ